MIDPETPVETPDNFFGQQSTVRRIFSRIAAERPQSIAVIGGRKTGKTSLLKYLSHERIKERYLEDPKQYILCNVSEDCSVIAEKRLFNDSESFILSVNKFLSSKMKMDGSKNHYNSLRNTVEAIHSKGLCLVLLLDDFHLITSNKNFPLEFFSFLRSLANNYNLAYVTTSFLELQKLCVIKDIEESPFFNIFTNLSLGPLSLDDGVKLLCSITDRDEESMKPIAEWCGTSPYILKLVGNKLINLEKANEYLYLNFEKTLLPEIDSYFEKIVSILPQEASKPLKNIARDKQPDPKEIYHLRPLLKQGFLVEENERISGFSPAFSLFLKKNLSNKMLLGKV